MTVRLFRVIPIFFRPHLAGALLPTTLLLVLAGHVFAEIRVVTGQGEYHLGNYDTKLDGERFAIEAAKRNALEQVATYLESVTVVRDLVITTDEIRSYTAGLLVIQDQQVNIRTEQNDVVIHAEIVAQVDSDQVVAAIAVLRENEDTRGQLVALRTELDDLHQELVQANARLAAATEPQQIQALTQQRQELLDQTRSNDLLSQAWTGWTIGGANVAYAPLVGYVPPQALVIQAWQAAPWNRHVQAAQQKIIPTTTLPPHVHNAPGMTSSSARLQAAIRPWSGLMPRPRVSHSHPYMSPGLMSPGLNPYPHMRPSMPSAPRFSGSGRSRGGGRGRR